MLINNILWSFGGRIFNQLLSLLFSIILTRLLSPSHFGLMGFILAYFVIARSVYDISLGAALIQKQKITTADKNTAFSITFLLSIVTSGITFLIAPFIANFYDQPNYSILLRALSFIMLISGANLTHQTLLVKEMRFKELTLVELVANIVSGICAILFAYFDFAVWSLIVYNFLILIIQLPINLFLVKWMPKFEIKKKNLNELLKVSKKIYLANWLENISDKMDVFIIGKVLNIKALGFYNRGKSFSLMITGVIHTTLSNVLFPYISKNKKNTDLIRNKINLILKSSILGAILLTGYFISVTEEIFNLLFGIEWVASATSFKYFLLIGICQISFFLIKTTLKGLGEMNNHLKLIFFNKILGMPLFLILIYFKLEIYLGFLFLLNLILANFYLYKLNKLFNLDHIQMIKTIMPSILYLALIYFLMHKYIILDNVLHSIIIKSIIYFFTLSGYIYFFHKKEIKIIKNLLVKN